MEPHSYVWLFTVGAIVAFAGGFGIGANDVANSFSTSIASRSLTLKGACCIAVLTEFFGALLLGAETTKTIGEGIIKISLFTERPDLLMFGMVCALIVSTVWVLFASSHGWPVSTTHSIVGAVAGVGIAAHGWGAIDWSFNGMSKIIACWVIAPIISGIAASIIFLATKYLVLVHQDTSFRRGLVAVPIYLCLIISVNVFYIVFQGPPALKLDNLKPYVVAPIVVGITFIVAIFGYFFYVPYLRRKIIGKEAGLKWYHVFVIFFIGERYENTSVENGTDNIEKEEIDIEENKLVQDDSKSKNIFKLCFAAIGKFVASSVNKEVADYKAHDNKEIHDAAVKYDPNTENLYAFLQVLVASFSSFAHGSNDVSNVIGPFSTIYLIFSSGVIEDLDNAPVWISVVGGLSIDVGLVLYGYHVMRSLGNRITYQSPSRGFSTVLGTSLVIITASKMGLPVSSTHCITGATTAVGLCNGNTKALNWKLIGLCFFSWILTVPVVAVLSGSMFAFATNAPPLR